MPTKKTSESKPKQDDAMLLNILNQLDILTNAIKMIDDDMEKLVSKVARKSTRMAYNE